MSVNTWAVKRKVQLSSFCLLQFGERVSRFICPGIGGVGGGWLMGRWRWAWPSCPGMTCTLPALRLAGWLAGSPLMLLTQAGGAGRPRPPWQTQPARIIKHVQLLCSILMGIRLPGLPFWRLWSQVSYRRRWCRRWRRRGWVKPHIML